MSILLKGPVSFCTIDMPEALQSYTAFRENFKDNSFKELTNEIPQNVSIGWVDPLDVSDCEEFANITIGSYYVVGVRIDSFKFSKAQLAPVTAKLIKEHGHFGIKLSKEVKTELKEAAFNILRVKAAPTSRLEYVFFDFVNKKIFILCKVKAVVSMIFNLITQTFVDVANFEEVYPVNAFVEDYVIRNWNQDLRSEFCGNWIFKKAREGHSFLASEEFEGTYDAVLNLSDTIKFRNAHGTDFSIKYKVNGSDDTVDELIEGQNDWKNFKMTIVRGQKEWDFLLDVSTTGVSSIKYTGDYVKETAYEDQIATRLDTLAEIYDLFKMLGADIIKDLKERGEAYGN